MAEPKESPESPDKSRSLMIGIIAVVLCAAIGVFFWTRRSPSTAPRAQASEAVGYVNMREAMKAHPDHEALENLYYEHDELKMRMTIDKRMLVSLRAPRAAKEPFNDAVRQKEKQTDIKSHGEALEKLKAAEAKDREDTRADFEARRDKINGEYFNEIFNIQMKLDNADTMRLKEEEVKSLTDRLHELQHERGQKQYALWQEHEAEIKARSDARAEAMGIDLKELNERTHERIASEEMRKQAEAERRNLEAVQKNLMESVAVRQRLTQETIELREKEREIASREASMMKDIAGLAMKIAVRDHLVTVFAGPARSIEAIKYQFVPSGQRPEKDAAVIIGTARDITEDIIKEIKEIH